MFLAAAHIHTAVAGQRACLGESVAKTQLFVTLAGLLQRYEFRSAAGDSTAAIAADDDIDAPLPDISDARLGITLSPPPFKLRMVKVTQ